MSMLYHGIQHAARLDTEFAVPEQPAYLYRNLHYHLYQNSGAGLTLVHCECKMTDLTFERRVQHCKAAVLITMVTALCALVLLWNPGVLMRLSLRQ